MEVQKLLDQSIINFDLLESATLSYEENFEDKTIFHYTSVNGLEGILSKNELYFTNIRYMNDKDEISVGLHSVAKACGANQEDEERLKKLIGIDEQIFICCFSLDGDSLPMWNYYTKDSTNKGYNIEFEAKSLVESILKSNPALDGCRFSFGTVDYSKDDTSEYSQAIIDEIVSSVKIAIEKNFMSVVEITSKSKNLDDTTESTNDALKDWKAKIEKAEKSIQPVTLPIYQYTNDPDGTCKIICEKSLGFLYFIKRQFFQNEREFRLVIAVPRKNISKLKDDSIYKFRISNGVLIPYLKIKFSKDIINGITVAPAINSDLVEDSIRDFLQYCSINTGERTNFIKRSKVPVRF